MPKKALQNCTITLLGRNPSWTQSNQAKVGGWLANLSGKYSSNFDASTTHLVVSKKRWTEEPRVNVIVKALKEKSEGRDLKIVSFDWLEDCLNSQSHKREAAYEWVRRDAENSKMAAKAAKGASKSVPGMLSEVFHESTDPFVDPIEKEKQDRQMEREKEARREREKLEKEERFKRWKEQGKIFGRGAKKARNEVMSETHHIYQDATGFKFDVLVTKVDTRRNRNERWALTIQIYESNTQPETYATNVHFSGTSIVPANNLVAALGTTFDAAFRAFQAAFKERTGIEWDERMSAHIRRLREEKRERGEGTGSVAPASTRGVPVSESGLPQNHAEVPFERRMFEYHPPGYGPKGEISEAEKARLEEMGFRVKTGTAEDVRSKTPAMNQSEGLNKMGVVADWVEGTEFRVDSPRVGATPMLDDIDFDALLNGEDYPFEKPLPEVPTQQANGYGLHGANFAGAGDAQPNGDIFNIPATTDDIEAAGAQDFDWNAISRDVADGDTSWMLNVDVNLHDGAGMHSDSQDFIDQGVQGEVSEEGNGVRQASVYEQGLPSGGGTSDLSLQAQMPSFTTHPTPTDTSFEPGTQDIGETQVAEKAGGEFLEEFGSTGGETQAQLPIFAQHPTNDTAIVGTTQQGAAQIADDAVTEQQPTPPSSAKKDTNSSYGKKTLGGVLNLGTSILGKRKAAVEGEEPQPKSPKA